MKLLMSWTISFLLSVQPAMVWAGTKTVSHRSEINNEIKNYLNKTGLTRKSMSVQEFYNNNKDLFDDAERASLEKMVKENGNVQIPKMDVTTVKNKAGEEVYQLQAVADGQSTSITLFGDQEEFARVNGVGISVKEGLSVEKTMAKLGTPKEAMDYYFRGPASVDGNAKKSKSRKPSNAGKLLSAEQVMKMNLEQKQKYFKQLRQLMESVESVQNAFNESPRGASLQNDFFQHVAGLMLGDQALADESGADSVSNDKACIIAGNISSQGVRPNGKRLTCGRDDKGELLGDITCAENKTHNVLVQCNHALYGSDAPCVAAGSTSTQQCNEKTKNKPLNFNDYKAYSEFKVGADAVIESAKGACGEKFDGSGTVSKFIPGMNTDQKNACMALSKRVAILNGLCPADSKETWCKAPAQPTTPAQPVTPTPAAGTSGSLPKCEDLENEPGYLKDGSVETDKCKDETNSVRVEKKKCDRKGSADEVSMCSCQKTDQQLNTSRSSGYICQDKAPASTVRGMTMSTEPEKKKKGFWSKTKGVFSSVGSWFGNHKKFFINLGIGLAVTGLVYKLAKKSTKAYYNNLDPVTPVAPITVPTVPPAREGAN